MTKAKREIGAWYKDRFAGFESQLNGQSKTPVQALRRRAIDHFVSEGFPTGRDEDWRHTNLNPITRIQFNPALEDRTGSLDPRAIAPFLIDDMDSLRLVFVNGRYDAGLSDVGVSDGAITVSSLRETMSNDPDLVDLYLGRNVGADAHGFSALNTAFLLDGAFVHIGEGVRAEKPIQLLFISVASDTPMVAFPRTLIVLEADADATIVESYAGTGLGSYLTDAATEVFLGERSRLEHCRIQRESTSAFHVSASYFRERTGSRLNSLNVDLGSTLCRNDIVTRLEGEQVESTLNGLYVAAGDQHVDNHTLIEHAAPDCESHELFKGVLGEKSTGVFRGKIHVHQVAQKTDAYQSNQNLLLSDTADVTSKPQLEIYADDVKCSHGSTTGQLDDQAVFYLRARGIGEREAMDLLTRAFADEILDRVAVEEVGRQLHQLVAEKLKSIHPQGEPA